jgi:phosphatidylglycerol---prolipoprotein diacylglyceryl transferase
MFNFLHTFQPNPILLELGPVKIHWYGFLMVLGGLIGLAVVLRLIKFYQIKKEVFFDLAFYWAIFCVIGGRIYYVLYSWSYYKDNLIDVFKIWEGGLAVHGVMIGAFLSTYFYCRKNKLNFWLIADLAVVGLVIAQVVGRVGNYFNQEIFGLPTDSAWGIPIDFAKRPPKYASSEYFHPTFLYESFFNLIIFCDLLGWHFLRIKKQPKFLFNGAIFCYYIFAYSVLRFFLEFLRIDQSPYVFGVRWAQLFSVILMVGAAVCYMILFRKTKIEDNPDRLKPANPS